MSIHIWTLVDQSAGAYVENPPKNVRIFEYK